MSSPITICSACNGNRKVEVCTKCGGEGKTSSFFGLGGGSCPRCFGKGFLPAIGGLSFAGGARGQVISCPRCNGSGM